MASRVKVDTAKLLEAVKARRASEVAAHKRAVAKYEKACGGYQDQVIAALENAAQRAADGRFPEHESRYSGKRLCVSVRFDRPDKPTLDTRSIDRLIATLEMAAEPSMVISSEDVARYLD